MRPFFNAGEEKNVLREEAKAPNLKECVVIRVK